MEESNVALAKYLQTFKKGNFIFLEGDGAGSLYMVHSGSVQLRRRLMNDELIIGTCGPGDFFGVVSAIEKWVYTETAEVTEDSEIYILKPAELEQLVINDSSLGFKVVNYLSNQLRELDIKLDKVWHK